MNFRQRVGLSLSLMDVPSVWGAGTRQVLAAIMVSATPAIFQIFSRLMSPKRTTGQKPGQFYMFWFKRGWVLK